MADNVPITPGSGADIAADDVSSVYYQYMKLASSESGSADLIGDLDFGAVRALYVHPRPDTVIPSSPINSAGLTTASTSTNYSNGDTLGTGWVVPNAVKASGGTGRIVGVTVTDVADIVASLTLYFFEASVTFGTDNVAPSISDADAAKSVGAPLTVYLNDLGGARVGGVDSISIPYYCAGSTDLYVYAVAASISAAFFGAVTDLKLRVALTRD